jgi:hypothetical protein
MSVSDSEILSWRPLEDEFKPGEKVSHSGIYTVLHDNNHVEPHEVTCVFGKVFPLCRGCNHPRFKLKYAAKHSSWMIISFRRFFSTLRMVHCGNVFAILHAN